jgi:hypothetical protein
MKRAIKLKLAAAFATGAILALLALTTSASALPAIVSDPPTGTFGGVVCHSHNASNGSTTSYPMDYDPSANRNTVHYWVCDGGTQAHDDVVGAEVRDFSIPLASRNVFLNGGLNKTGVVVYFFANRTDYSNFIQAKYNDSVTFAPGTAQCGKTSWQRSSGIITTAVWGTCAYSPNLLGNLDLTKVIAHEAGHAFDYALAQRDTSGDPKSHKPDFINNVAGGTDPVNHPTGDLATLQPANWATLATQTQINYVCAMFGTFSSSALEQALTAPNNAVCSNGSTIVDAYRIGGLHANGPQSPTAIMKTRLPYFTHTAPLYEDLWAEIFSNIANPNPSTVLQMTDQALKGGGGLGNPRSYNCSRTVVEQYVQTQQPPTPAVMTAAGCPTGSY